MKYAFLTTLIPPSMYDEVSLKSKRNMQDAASALQWHIYNGLRTNLKQEIKIFNVLPIGSFPQYYSDLFVRGSDFNDENSERHANIGFCNLKLFRKWHQPKVIYKRLKKWCAEDNEPKTLFVYTVGAQLMAAVSRLKKRYPTLKVCAVVADLPNMSDLSSKRSFLLRCFSGFMSVKAYSQLDTVDAFVLLTEQMADYMKINVPYCVMEGISTKPQREPDFVGTDDIKTILYTGTLHKKFGIMNLVDAFSQIENENYRLVICGLGDSENEIREAASKDSRIEFLGQKTRSEALELQAKATVLVNPRQNNEEFTKYSFPSKNLEYLSSGKPLLAYKLDGIPDEYDDVIIYVEDNSIRALADKLTEVCEYDKQKMSEHCKRAYEFVMTQKNEVRQTERILNMLREKGIL